MMKLVRENLRASAEIINEELKNDSSPFFHPVAKGHKIFQQAYMKFVNRNLNYFNCENMIVTALKEEKQDFNLNLKKTLQFCNYVKKIEGKENAPFGRMCVWMVPPKHRILPHIDNFEYHSLIDRYIFFVSEHPAGSIIVNINNERARSEKGTLFKFSPHVDLHEFHNTTDHLLYFLGFDIWNVDKLNQAAEKVNFEKIMSNPDRYNKFGHAGTKCKYISEH